MHQLTHYRSASRTCQPISPSSIDTSAYTHILVRSTLCMPTLVTDTTLCKFAYASVASDGTVTLSSDQQAQLSAVLALGNDVKIYLAGGYHSCDSKGLMTRTSFSTVGGWGLGTDPTPLQHAAVNSGGARTHMANSLASLVSTYVQSLAANPVDLSNLSAVTALMVLISSGLRRSLRPNLPLS